MRCICVDDEPKALYVVKSYIEKVPSLTLSGAFRDALQALAFVQSNPVDLLFLDINMPDITGVQFLKALPRHPLVIFTTAYTEYAVKSYEFQAVDYLLKPIAFDRFLMAVNRAHELHKLKSAQAELPLAQPTLQPAATQANPFFFVKSGQQTYRLNLADILYVEGSGNYVAFVTTTKKILSHLTMAETLEILPPDRFCRVHKSYVIALDHIVLIERHCVQIGQKEIPIGAMYREAFMKRVDQMLPAK